MPNFFSAHNIKKYPPTVASIENPRLGQKASPRSSSTGFAALVASLPLTSLLAFVWLHLDGTAASEIGTLSRQIFWLVLPSLILFLLLPVLLERGIAFWPSLGFSMLATVGGYFLMLWALKKFGMVMS